MVIVSLFALTIISYFLFLRSFPVFGLVDIEKKKVETNNFYVIDLRDYNESYKDPLNIGMNIPIAYLKRYYNEIPNLELIVVASNCMERNIGVRILRKKGFKVVGYKMTSRKEIGKEKHLRLGIFC
ncbi:rhodanese-like domain-containing protein [Metabacillus halosaccharovorans]|uniref:hypothetical protein n=1 Tax=Metabacillus halosaccharovorans TaxID=930124 RepID=UPI003735B6B3